MSVNKKIPVKINHWGDNDLSHVEINPNNPVQVKTKLEIKRMCFNKFSSSEDAINNSIVITKEVEKYTKIYRITLGAIISMGIILVITSIIAYKYSVQTSGYKCLTCSSNYYLMGTGSIYCASKKLYNETCLSSNEC